MAEIKNMVVLLYAAEDEAWAGQVRKHLTPLTSSGHLRLVEPFSVGHSQLLQMGDILLIPASVHFLVNDLLMGLLKEWLNLGKPVLWFPVSPALYEESVFSDLELVFPEPLDSMSSSEIDRSIVCLAHVLKKAIDDLNPKEVKPPLRLRRISLSNIRNIERLSLDCATRTLLLGDNSSGKSSVLRAIALGLSGEAEATSLLNRLPGNFIRGGRENGTIELELEDEAGRTYRIKTLIKRTASGSEVVRKTTAKNFPWDRVFVCGYGAQRSRSAESSFSDYTLSAAVETMFDLDASLQNPELVLLRQPESVRHELARLLISVLRLDPAKQKIEFTQQGVFLKSATGRIRLEALSDGFRGTSQWLLDMVAWFIYAGRMTEPGELEGIVLIDELEQHLHPQWQREVIEQLRGQFPKIQFIITTHSPLIAASVGDLDFPDLEKLYLLDHDQEKVIAELRDTKGMSADQILATQAFGYQVQADPQVEAVLREASILASKERNEEEEARYQAVKHILSRVLRPEGVTAVEREVRQDIHEAMKKEIEALERAVFGETR